MSPASAAVLAATAVLLAGCAGSARMSATASTHTAPARSHATQTATTPRATVTLAADRGVTPQSVSGVPPLIKPRIVWDPIPFGTRRKAEMAAYAARHYGIHTYRLINPHVIVIHYTDGPSFLSAFNTFAPDVPDIELHELPGTCSHFVIDPGGVIHQLVSLSIMCRHTVGLNWTAIGIEHVGYSDQQILRNPRELGASLRLVRWLRCRFHITIANVIGHNESLSSPYHHERVAALRTQTHGDWVHGDMQIYRRRLRQLGGCPG
jgi:beta-N-acetylhexosaminidase